VPLGGQGRSRILYQRLAESIDAPEGRPQVVRDGVAERLELRVGAPQIGRDLLVVDAVDDVCELAPGAGDPDARKAQIVGAIREDVEEPPSEQCTALGFGGAEVGIDSNRRRKSGAGGAVTRPG
jgi:hypothetical protein